MCAEGGRQDPTGRPAMGQLGQRWIWKPEHRVGSSPPTPPRGSRGSLLALLSLAHRISLGPSEGFHRRLSLGGCR